MIEVEPSGNNPCSPSRSVDLYQRYSQLPFCIHFSTLYSMAHKGTNKSAFLSLESLTRFFLAICALFSALLPQAFRLRSWDFLFCHLCLSCNSHGSLISNKILNFDEIYFPSVHFQNCSGGRGMHEGPLTHAMVRKFQLLLTCNKTRRPKKNPYVNFNFAFVLDFLKGTTSVRPR